MNAVPLTLRTPDALAEVLRAHGWAEGLLLDAASGLGPLAVHLTGLDADTLEALRVQAARAGLDLLTGDGWAVVAGTRGRLGALARPGQAPEALTAVALAVAGALPAPPPALWRTARGELPLDPPLIVGILNVTPDSFSDGGRFAAVDAAVAHADRLVRDGAGMLDVGGESTRPGRTEEVPAAEEIRRVVPVLERLARELPHVPVAVDTVKGAVARAALDAGAAAVNDVAGLRFDPDLAAAVARAGAGLVLMHSRGAHLALAGYDEARYADLLGEVLAELRAGLEAAGRAGIPPEAVVVDPGFGFAKTPAHSLRLLGQLDAMACLGRPVYVGASRKRFLGAVSGRPVEERDALSATAAALAVERGARIVRTHDVRLTRDAIALALALASPPPDA